MALSLGGINDLMVGIRAILNVGASADFNGIYLIEPFDPRRIPVLLIHGLTSSPLVWRNVATRCRESVDPGKLPILVCLLFVWHARSAIGALIRERIAVIRHSGDPHGITLASKDMVVVGYSMGGLIAGFL